MQKAFVPPEVLTMTEMETFLSKNVYLSGTENPGQIDSQMIDHFQLGRVVPDRSHFPNCFSWYWSLAVFSRPTRALWNPLNIDPSLSDSQSVDNSAKNSKKSGNILLKSPTGASKREFQVHCNTLDFPSGSHEQPTSGHFEPSLKISQISSNKSHSANSNIQDCQELVDGLRRNGSVPNLHPISDQTGPKPQPAQEKKTDEWSENQLVRSVEANTNLQIITSKIIPERSTNQLRICELITSSFESTIVPKRGNRVANASWEEFSEDSANFLGSPSQKENRKKTDQMEIQISANYSFFHDTDTCTEQKQPPEKQGTTERRTRLGPEIKETNTMENYAPKEGKREEKTTEEEAENTRECPLGIDWNCQILTSDSLENLLKGKGKKESTEAISKMVRI